MCNYICAGGAFKDLDAPFLGLAIGGSYAIDIGYHLCMLDVSTGGKWGSVVLKYHGPIFTIGANFGGQELNDAQHSGVMIQIGGARRSGSVVS